MMTMLQIMSDEPLICPVTPGTALCRLSEVAGALERHFAPPEWPGTLRQARGALETALETGETERVAGALHAAQGKLSACYDAVCALDDAAPLCAALGFPAPGKASFKERFVAAVDVATLQVTYTRFGKQVLTNFSFRDAQGATAYWLHEIRYIDGDRSEWARLEDAILESYSPQFTRVRMGAGTRHFVIESRNPHTSAYSAEFTLEVPSL